MTTKKILHKLLKGACSYTYYGVPKPIWKVIKKLTEEVYGSEGLRILKEVHETYEEDINEGVEGADEDLIILHSVDDAEKLIDELENRTQLEDVNFNPHEVCGV